MHIRLKKGFPSGQLDEVAPKTLYDIQDFIDEHLLPLIERILGIAVGTTDIAIGETDEDTGETHVA